MKAGFGEKAGAETRGVKERTLEGWSKSCGCERAEGCRGQQEVGGLETRSGPTKLGLGLDEGQSFGRRLGTEELRHSGARRAGHTADDGSHPSLSPQPQVFCLTPRRRALTHSPEDSGLQDEEGPNSYPVYLMEQQNLGWGQLPSPQ